MVMNPELTTSNHFTAGYYSPSRDYLYLLYPYGKDALLRDGIWRPISSSFCSSEGGCPWSPVFYSRRFEC